VTDQKPPAAKEQLLLQHARREAALIMGVWLLALVWTVGTYCVLGLRRNPAEMKLVLGMPDWVFWGVVLPWGLSLIFTVWFCYCFMADDDLGQDPVEDAAHE
jgi:Protein of unknown function (DUF997)